MEDNKKELIEKQVINYIIKAIDTHVNLMENSSVVINNPTNRERIAESITHLKKAKYLLRSNKKQIALSKRNAYLKYTMLKKELQELKINKADEEIINEKRIEIKKYLEYYESLKDLHSML